MDGTWANPAGVDCAAGPGLGCVGGWSRPSPPALAPSVGLMPVASALGLDIESELEVSDVEGCLSERPKYGESRVSPESAPSDMDLSRFWLRLRESGRIWKDKKVLSTQHSHP